MSLEELSRSRIIQRIRPNHRLALNALKRARRDIETAKTLVKNNEFDWALAISYNAMLQAGRALMFEKGYRPSTNRSHVAVVKYLHATLGTEASDRIIMLMNGVRKKRHRVVYEQMDIVSKSEAERTINWANEFVNRIHKEINQKQHKNERKKAKEKSYSDKISNSMFRAVSKLKPLSDEEHAEFQKSHYGT